MKIIVKNGSLEFLQVKKEPQTPVGTTPRSYVKSAGDTVVAAGSTLYVDFYQVQSGKNYVIKSNDDAWETGPTEILTLGISFGTNRLAGRGAIDNSVLIGQIEKTAPSIYFAYTPQVDGYIYVSCSAESGAKKVSSVYLVG